MAASAEPVDWRVSGSYFEGCNCEAICPCRSVRGAAGGPSTFGECFGALSWHVLSGHAEGIDLSDTLVVMTLRYFDRVQPSTPWEVVLYIDDRTDEAQAAALASIFLGHAGGTVAAQYGPAIGEVRAIRRARINIEHVATRKRIDVPGYIVVEAEEPASAPGEVAVESRASTGREPNWSTTSPGPTILRCDGKLSAAARRLRRTSTIEPRQLHADTVAAWARFRYCKYRNRTR